MTNLALTRLGYRVLLANNGNEAKKDWQGNRQEIELLLTDMVMPQGVTGREIARLFKAEKPGLKIIVMSGYSADIAGIDFCKTDGHAFLGKPFDIDTLGTMVRQCFEQLKS